MGVGMTNQKILEKAISIAVDGGWVYHGLTDEGKIHYLDTGIVVDWLRGGREAYQLESIIFNHEFAKALWSEGQAGLSEANGHWYEPISRYDERSYIEVLDLWEYHLQQMVIADDPIEYLGENI